MKSNGLASSRPGAAQVALGDMIIQDYAGRDYEHID